MKTIATESNGNLGEKSKPLLSRCGRLNVCTLMVAIVCRAACWGLESFKYNMNKGNCASNLHQIGLAIAMYCHDKHDEYPDSFATILKTEQLPPVVFLCPSIDLPDVYLGRGMTEKTVKDNIPIAFEPLSNHSIGMNVLFGDGHAGWVKSAHVPSINPSRK